VLREHGVLKRVMVVYDEVLRRWDKKQDVAPEILADASGMIRHFVEDSHEKLEEDYLFPQFEKANKLTNLVKTLKAQHQAGRKVTSESNNAEIGP
jgi:hemerythrin-like domain-containing protein